MDFVFIINPIAGKSDESEHLQQQISNCFSDNEYIICKTEYEHHASELAYMYASKYPSTTIIACGGDGTLREVLQGLQSFPNIKFGIVPIGTGNDFIRYFDEYTRDDFLDFERLKNGVTFQSDIITCNNQACLNIASIGFDAKVVQKVDKFKRIPFVSGSVAYLISVIAAFFSHIKFKHSLILDDTTTIPLRSYLFVVIANAKFYGGGFYPSPMASIQDGILDVITIDSLSRPRILSLISKYRKAKHLEYDFTNHYTCKKIQVLSDKNIIVNLDGETMEVSNPTFEVKQKAITLLLPSKD